MTIGVYTDSAYRTGETAHEVHLDELTRRLASLHDHRAAALTGRVVRAVAEGHYPQVTAGQRVVVGVIGPAGTSFHAGVIVRAGGRRRHLAADGRGLKLAQIHGILVRIDAALSSTPPQLPWRFFAVLDKEPYQ